jgi:hypothetical protein
MYYLLLLLLLILVGYSLTHVLGFAFKGCLSILFIAIISYLAYVFIMSSIRPMSFFGLYEIDNFRIIK